MARELNRPIRLLIANQPTRGLDVGSIEFIHRRLVEKRDAGVAVLLVSAELDEIMGLSDRIAVIFKGKFTAIVDADDVSKEQVGLMMAGSSLEEALANAPRPVTKAKSIVTCAEIICKVIGALLCPKRPHLPTSIHPRPAKPEPKRSQLLDAILYPILAVFTALVIGAILSWSPTRPSSTPGSISSTIRWERSRSQCRRWPQPTVRC